MEICHSDNHSNLNGHCYQPGCNQLHGILNNGGSDKGVAIFFSLVYFNFPTIISLLVGLEHNDCVAIYNTSSTNYSIKSVKSIAKKNQDSEPFLLRITGEAYNEN